MSKWRLGVLTAALVGVVLWAAGRTEIGGGVTERARAAGWSALVGEQVREAGNSFGPLEFKAKRMATTAVPGENLSCSFTFRHALWPGMDASNLYQFSPGFSVVTPLGSFEIRAEYDAISHPGEIGIYVGEWDVLPPVQTIWFSVPASEDDIYWLEIPFSITMSGNTATRLTHSEQPLGDKAATHSKECITTEEWFVPAGTTYSVSIGEQSFTVTTTVDRTAALTMTIGGSGMDCDDWSDYMVGTKYAMSVEDVKFGAVEIDTSAFAATTWGGTSASVDKLWVEGFGGNSIGFWCSESFYNGAFVYNSYDGGTVTAPLSYDFSGIDCKWMDGVAVASTLEVYCTGIRTLSSGGVDIGPWHGTLAALKALGRYTQKHGCYYWDSYDADMSSTVELYLDLTSAEALGIEVRGPQPAYKVEGAGYGVTVDGETIIPGPYDGQYAAYGTYNGETLYTNGHGYLYCTDPDAGDWAIGPGPPTSPYYVQEAGGPAGAYTVSESYTDDVIDEETGQRRFSGFSGEGVGPAVSADTTEAISVDSDCATPAWTHDATFIIDFHAPDAPDRTSSPYMTDVALIEADAAKGIYANAHDHTDWVGTDCTTPASDGTFTVTSDGGSLLLTLKCNYRDRQALVGGTGEIPVPTAYRNRRHDSCLGDGATPETAEAVWDWRGRYLTQSFKDLSLPCDLTCTVTYYDDLAGCSDNHKTDSTRQTEYAYDPGDLYTLTRVIPVTYADGTGWSSVLVDLYDEQNVHPVAMAVSLKWTFPDAGAYQMTEPTLTQDPGDRQEVTSTDPYYREAPDGTGLAIKCDEPWRYAQGLLSGHFAGFADRVLFVPDNAKPNAVEKTFDTLEVSIGAQTGEDLTTCRTLAGLPITNSGEAWTYTHDAAAEAAHMTDADDVVLKALNAYDIAPQMTGTGALNVAVRCFRVVTVPGLPYTFYGTKYVGGRAHGMGLKATKPSDFPRTRGAGVGKLYRQHLDADPAAWALVQTLTTDEHGHWESAAYGITDTDATRTLWEWKTNASEFGRFATREWALAEALAAGQLCYITRDAMGEPIWAACVEGNAVKSYTIVTASDWWESPTTALTGSYRIPSLCVHDDGSIIVGATNTAESRIDVVRSRNCGATWEAVNVAFGTGLENGTLFALQGQVYLVGWASDKVYLVGSSAADLTREALDGTNTEIEVCDFEAATDADKPIVSVTMDDAGQVLVAVAGGGDTAVYASRNLLDGFALLS